MGSLVESVGWLAFRGQGWSRVIETYSVCTAQPVTEVIKSFLPRLVHPFQPTRGPLHAHSG